MDQNPYASPETVSSALRTFYATEITKLTVPELWRIGWPNILGFLIVLVAKLSGSSLRNNVVFAADGVEFLDTSDRPQEVNDSTQAIRDECRSLGFDERFSYSKLSIGDTAVYVIEMANHDGTISATIVYVQSRAANNTKERVFMAFGSEFADGIFVSTSSGRREMNDHPSHKEKHFIGASPSSLLQFHEEHLEEYGYAHALRRDDEALQQSVLKREHEVVEFNIQRGVFVPLTDSELEELVTEISQCEETFF